MAAFGMTLLSGSVTWPVMVPRYSCAHDVPGNRDRTHNSVNEKIRHLKRKEGEGSFTRLVLNRRIEWLVSTETCRLRNFASSVETLPLPVDQYMDDDP